MFLFVFDFDHFTASVISNGSVSVDNNRRNSLLHQQQDEAFLSLLSSQRELLHQLNIENARRREQEYAKNNMSNMNISNNRIPTTLIGPTCTLNRSCMEMRSEMELLYTNPRRFSLGLSCDNIVLPDLNFDNERIDLGYDDIFTMGDATMEKSKRLYMDDDAGYPSLKKRRMSNLGLTSTFFEDYLKPLSRRGSMFSIVDPYESDEGARFDHETETIDKTVEVVVQSVSATNIQPKMKAPVPVPVTPKVPIEMSKKHLSPAEMKKVMESFTTAMERSQKTQQDIHDWDRKMGLKRSHSKTMRLSSRSRKKLRMMLRKEINSLSSKSN
jgi:hypothetical protein